MSDELLYNTVHGGGYQLPAMLQQKERVVSVGHSRETGKKLATACRSRELRRGGGKGRGLAPTWPSFRATTTVSVLLTFGGQDQDLRCKQRRRINSKTFRSTSATSVALFKRVAIGVNHHTLHYWLTSSQSPIKGRLALAACFLQARRIPVGVFLRDGMYLVAK